MAVILNEKYLLEVNGRYDGTSKFPKNDRFGFFPSVSAGWRISNESFMNWMKPAVDELKLRASYGTLGNQNVSSNFPYISTMNYYQNNDGDGRLASFQDGHKVMVVDPSGLVSPSLTWVKLKTLDFGFDYSMAKNRLNLSYDWYNRETDGILGTQAAPAILGTNPPLQNLYSMGTKGWELTFSWKDRINENFSYNVGLNLSDYTGKVIKYDANPTHYIFDFYNGQTMGDIWGWKDNSLFQTNEEATAWENQYKQSLVFGTPPGGYMAGDMKFEDTSKNGAIDKGTETADNPGDRSVIGNNTPRYSFGITGGIAWKGFDFNVFFQGVGKRDWQMGQGDNSMLLWGPEGRAWDYNLDYWSETNTGAYYPRVSGIRVSETTRYLQNAAYIRLKSLVLGYSIPKTFTQRFGIDVFRVYFSGQNLWTYTKLIKGVDPEGIQDPYGYGDGQVYPIQKSLSVGLNVTF